MVKPANKGESRPTCVNQLLNRLSEATDSFQAGESLGPYLVEALLEDIQLCPALELADNNDAHRRLEQALEQTRHSVRAAMVCPMIKRDWAAQELRTSISNAQDCLDQWRKSTSSGSGDLDANSLMSELKRIDSPRCANCAFAEQE